VPRQIIDTESSRPAYVRRITGIVVIGVLVLAAIALLGYAIVAHGWRI
jgi:hypothetical protein